MKNESNLLSTRDAARILGFNHAGGAVAKYINDGSLDACRIGGRWVIRIEDLERFAATPRKKRGRPKKET